MQPRVKREQEEPTKLDNYRLERERQRLSSDEESLKSARQHLKEAQRSVKDACAPFTNKMHPGPEQFRKAVQLLEAAEQSIHALCQLIKRPSTPKEITKTRVDVEHQASIIFKQIDTLIPTFRWNNKGDFSLLQKALNTIETLLPEQDIE